MISPGIVIEPARAGDAADIAALLRDAGLPHDDAGLRSSHFLVAREDGRPIGAIGAEVHAPDALLRSLVVAPAKRGSGLGGELVRRLDLAAGAWGVGRWWLLTTTAERFFSARGFVVAPRAAAPDAIRRTGQFSGEVCASAACLTRARTEAL
jgi:N-acetylglutamate synthase-like GNAT family acetyltransferase